MGFNSAFKGLTSSGIHSALMNLAHANSSYFAAVNPRHLPGTSINLGILKPSINYGDGLTAPVFSAVSLCVVSFETNKKK